MNVAEIGDYLRLTHPYLFRQQQTTSGVSNAVTKEAPPNKAEMDLAARCAYIRQHGEQAFLDLPDNPVTAKPLIERPRSSWTVEENADFVRRHGAEEYFKIPA